jgi:hypothetical protein
MAQDSPAVKIRSDFVEKQALLRSGEGPRCWILGRDNFVSEVLEGVNVWAQQGSLAECKSPEQRLDSATRRSQPQGSPYRLSADNLVALNELADGAGMGWSTENTHSRGHADSPNTEPSGADTQPFCTFPG